MRKLIFSFLSLWFASSFAYIPEASLRNEIAATPEKAGGIYFAYPFSTDSMPAAPAGYEPVYLSHYGRHGSRWAIRENIYPLTIGWLHNEEINGNLTDNGKRLVGLVRKCRDHAAGHPGELSALGERQHKEIARRMMNRFPAIFDGTSAVVARSSTEPRCIVSMAAFCEALKEGNNALRMERHASPGDMEFIHFTSPEAKALGQNSAPWQDRFSQKRDSLTLCMETAKKFFKNPSAVNNLAEGMRTLFDVAIAVQDVDGLDADILSLFTPEDLYNQWKSANYSMYVRNSDSVEGNGEGARCAANLINNIVGCADEALSGNGKAKVDLRFGHDTALMRLLALMGINGADARTEGVDNAAEACQTFRIVPMAANLQLAFFRNASGDIIVAPRLNERPVAVSGLAQIEDAPGFYQWKELRELWLSAASPVAALAERVAPGSSKRFIFRQVESPENFFEISGKDGKPVISGNNHVNIAAGLNWYLKYYPGIHLSWNNMHAVLPASLPLPVKPERRTTDASRRYYLNYCTHSYSMAFWDKERWQREIDWMALHGINMPLAITGTDVVWRNTLLRLGYSKEEADGFVAGPAFQAWWLMNNLEGWGGPNSEQWYEDRADLQRFILARMREYGMTPVLPGYSGMVPHDADIRLGVDVSGKGLWNGFVRPAFLKTTDPMFNRIADIYYDELTKLCGPAAYYSMDPFHEGGSTEGVDLAEAGTIITKAMKRANPDAVWVIQGWNENPRPELLAGVPKGDIVVLDLASEIKPNWGDPDSPSLTKRDDGYAPHDWMFCMIDNFGGNVGLHGRMDNVIEGYYKARDSKYGASLTGYGLTPEGIENNPVMYELVSELIWRPEEFSKHDWLKAYAKARYGKTDGNVDKAWKKLSETIYNCPWGNMQQGTTESVFCARPSDDVWQVSSWSRMAPYYSPEDVIKAVKDFAKGAVKLKGNENYRYDLVDFTRQALAEKGRLVYRDMQDALKSDDPKAFDKASSLFLRLLKAQDELLSTRKDFSVQTWIDDAKSLASSPEERDNMERNARLLVSTWGPREASEEGGLRDYAHREWAGLLGDLYYNRWKTWIDNKRNGLDSNIDFYEIDEAWVNSRDSYDASDVDCVDTALKVIKEYL